MDDKTDTLRDIFLDVADEETLTESQQQERGSLSTDGEPVDDRLESVIEQLREKFEIESSFPEEKLCHVVRHFYAGKSDEAIASTLDETESAVFRARMDLHLVRDEDGDEKIELAIRDLDSLEGSATDIAATLDESPVAVERTLAASTATDRSRRVSHRFRTAFEEILTDADLSVRLTADTHDTGLDDATEGAETNVEF